MKRLFAPNSITHKIGLCLFSITGYLLFFFVTIPYIGRIAVVFSIIPLSTFALLFGRWAGFGAGIALYIFNIMLFHLAGESEPQSYLVTNYWMAHFAFTFTGFIIGYLQDLRLKLKTEIKVRESIEFALNQTEQKFRDLVEVSSNVIGIFSTEGLVEYANPPAEELTGYTVHELIGMHYNQLVHPDWHEKISSFYIEQAKNKTKVSTYTFPIITKQGKIRWVEQTVDLLIRNEEVVQLHTIVKDVTDQVEAENALRFSEERFRALTENISDITIVANSEGKTTYVSPAAYRASGYTGEELVGNIRKKILTEESAKIIENALVESKDSPSKTIQIPLITGKHKDGHTIYFEGTITNMLHIPSVEGFVFTGKEITDRVKTEHILQDIQLRYQALFDRSIDAVFIMSLDQKFMAVNDRAADLLGYPVEELLSMGVADVVVQVEFDHSQETASDLLKGETPLLYERTFVRKDGSLIVGEISAALVQDSEGNPAYFQSIVRDITERKQAEQALIEKDYRYQALFNQSNDAVFIIGLDGIIQNVNQRAAEMHGYEIEEMIGMHTKDLAVEEERQDSIKVIDELLAGKEFPVYERLVRTKSGDIFPIEINIALVRDPEGKPLNIQSVSRDISQRKETEEQLRHLATHDALTDLPNRTLFYERLNRAVARAQRHESKFAIFFLDLDNF